MAPCSPVKLRSSFLYNSTLAISFKHSHRTASAVLGSFRIQKSGFEGVFHRCKLEEVSESEQPCSAHVRHLRRTSPLQITSNHITCRGLRVSTICDRFWFGQDVEPLKERGSNCHDHPVNQVSAARAMIIVPFHCLVVHSAQKRRNHGRSSLGK